LNELKNKIEKTDDWDFKKRYINPYELVFTLQNDPRIPNNISVLKPLSRSYFKMIEMLQLSNFFKSYNQNTNLRSAHVAEGPGGFIEAFVDESQRNKLKPKEIHAMTLKPKQVHVPGWKRAHNFLQKNKYISIEYGADDTGDIYVSKNRDFFINSCKKGVHLFTADGGFDFTDNFENQEEMIFDLLMASTLIGLKIMLPGGLFILKIFDFYKPKTHSLLYSIASCFKEWAIYKPLMSRPCNSERYFIGKDFIKWNGSFFNEKEIPATFIKELENFQNDFDTLQINYLEKAFAVKEPYEWALHKQKAIQWSQNFHIPFHYSISDQV